MGLESVRIKPNFPKVNDLDIFELTGLVASACVTVNVSSFLLGGNMGNE